MKNRAVFYSVLMAGALSLARIGTADSNSPGLANDSGMQTPNGDVAAANPPATPGSPSDANTPPSTAGQKSNGSSGTHPRRHRHKGTKNTAATTGTSNLNTSAGSPSTVGGQEPQGNMPGSDATQH